MVELKKDTKRAQYFICSYSVATTYQLSQVYKDYSNAKARAFIHCESVAHSLQGFARFIIGANFSYFTYAFLTKVYDNIVDLHIITYANHYVIKNLLIDEI